MLPGVSGDPKQYECTSQMSSAQGECIPVQHVVTYLEIKICKDEKERGQLHFQPVLPKIKINVIWLMRDFSLNGIIILLN